MSVTCPIRIDVMEDTEEEVATKWQQIKKWYKEHPEVNPPWKEWEKSLPNPSFTIGQRSSFRGVLGENPLMHATLHMSECLGEVMQNDSAAMFASNCIKERRMKEEHQDFEEARREPDDSDLLLVWKREE